MSSDFNSLLNDELDSIHDVAPALFAAVEEVDEAIRFAKMTLLANRVHNIQAVDVVSVARLIMERHDKIAGA